MTRIATGSFRSALFALKRRLLLRDLRTKLVIHTFLFEECVERRASVWIFLLHHVENPDHTKKLVVPG
jgi:hypothetical protein